MSLSDIVQNGWNALGRGEFDLLVSDYTDDMVFIMPGQTDILEGKEGFRIALDSVGEILPLGFEITELRQIEGTNEVVTILEWKSQKIESSQLVVLFKFKNKKIYEERWFVDTEQWKSAF